MTPYIHKVHYYETDKMGITHHSNYIRWMEEARVAFLNEIGWSYSKLEEVGLISPVLGVNCRYLHPTVFDEEVRITVKVKELKLSKMKVGYRMENAKGEVVAEGESDHAFLLSSKPAILKRDFPGLFEAVSREVEVD